MKINNIEFDDFIFSNHKEETNEYTQKDFMNEQYEESQKGRIGKVFQRLAMKNYICEKCGQEIHKNETYFQYKPLPTRKHWFTWRNRCIDCEPIYYDEVDLYEDLQAREPQVNLRKDFLLTI